MRHGTTQLWLLVAVLTTTVAAAQDMPDIGFQSVGRGRPLAVSAKTQPPVGPAWKGNAFAPPHPGVKQELDGYPASAAEGRDAAPDRHLHEQGLLQGRSAVDRQALLPLQQSDGERSAARNLEPESAEHGEGRGSAVGPLRSRFAARGDREPVWFQDGAGALRGAARRDA